MNVMTVSVLKLSVNYSISILLTKNCFINFYLPQMLLMK